MRQKHFARCLLCAAFLLAAADPGCLSLHHPKTVAVLIRDAETKQPIRGAEVKLMCLSARTAQHTPETSGATGGDGVVRLPAARDADSALVEGTAKGYLTEEASVPAAALAPGKPARPGDPAPADFVLEVYAEPRVTVDLVVPNGYRGLIKVEVAIQPEAPWTAGQRAFRCEVPPSRVIRLEGPPLLRHLRAADYSAHYADGTPLRQPKEMLDVGLRWLKCEAYDQYFVVGTQVDWNAVRHLQEGPGENSRPAGGGRGGGGGGHGRHRRGGGGD